MDEFRQLFQQEAEAQLTRLGENVLQLESSGDPELVQQLFRDAHSIKGASAMVGFADVSRVAHRLEDILDQLRSGKRAAEPALVDAVLRAVDVLRELIAKLMLDEDAGSEADAAEAALREFADAGSTPGSAGPSPARPASTAPAAPATADETIAVPVERLDELVRLVNESSAALLRVGRFIEERIGEDDAQNVGEFRELARVLGALQERTMRARMVSVGTIGAPLRRTVRDAARATLKQATWEIAGDQTQLDRHVLETLRDPLMHLVRNSVDHGLEPPEVRVERGKPAEGVVRLTANQVGSDVEIVIS
ncbi:MAG: two-component system, chemotaxis family, sensor kinase CheA, partial [Thermoleophilaceae bacterium]|nr:two-component system, chemotaxis family, sensor kinase CheA [Thermoleophilaceae bacterium]